MNNFYYLFFLKSYKYLIEKRCDSIESMKNKIPSLRDELNDPETFKKIYRFAFLFGRQETQRSLELGIAIGLWQVCI